ncbi:MAG TPA: pyrimidine reductase family protein [Pseudonocardia sp.]|nr:pyrimidine reductase family protein [Pseudonocardia sp.]
MLRLWPSSATDPPPPTDDELAEVYAYPEPRDRPYLRMNFVASADGAATAGGVSKGLSSPPDRQVFGLLRELAEVILVGAGTARAENYRGARRPSRVTGRPPRIAVVTASAQLDPAAPLFTDTEVPPLILTAESAPAANRRRLADAGAEVLALPGDRVAPAHVLATLAERGLYRVLCEGGPHLFGELLAADVVDELCLTVAPILAGGGFDRIAMGPDHPLRGMRLASVLTEDHVLLLRYLRDR